MVALALVLTLPEKAFDLGGHELRCVRHESSSKLTERLKAQSRAHCGELNEDAPLPYDYAGFYALPANSEALT